MNPWLRAALAAAFFRPLRLPDAAPSAKQFVAMLVCTSAIELLLARLQVEGPARFLPVVWLASWWLLGAQALVFWAVLDRTARPGAVAALLMLWLPASLVPGAVHDLLQIAAQQGVLGDLADDDGWRGWGIYLVILAWLLAIVVRLARAFGLDRRRASVSAAGVFALLALATWLSPGQPWRAEQAAATEAEAPRLVLTQDLFEQQQALWTEQVEALAPQRPGVADVYGIVFAPYADEDVFLRESTLVAGVLAERFDAAGRVLHLVNHPTTARTRPWATPLNLKRAIDAVAERMDRDEDVLVVYLTSHGASNFQLAASHGALDVEPVTPTELRKALDEAGVRHRVVAISACFSGGWVGPLASPGTLVMTAADATHTSYGCGRLSELTFFGRALFDEQLRKTHSFEQAFQAAVPIIRQREVEAKKPDGFSNPQIAMGEQVRPVLEAVAKRLDGTGAAAKP